MLRRFRTLHRLAGLVGSLFLIVIAVTGFLLALKSVIPNIRPATEKGGEVATLKEGVHPSVVLEAATSVGLPELRSIDDVDRFELHVGKNVYKVLSKDGYHEVQVDGLTGKVLGVGRRNDQLFEDIHDLSFLHPTLRITLLPVVALLLLTLGVSGLVMYFVPILRRRRFEVERRGKS